MVMTAFTSQVCNNACQLFISSIMLDLKDEGKRGKTAKTFIFLPFTACSFPCFYPVGLFASLIYLNGYFSNFCLVPFTSLLLNLFLESSLFSF